MHRSILISNSRGIFSAFGRFRQLFLPDPGGTIRMAFGGTNKFAELAGDTLGVALRVAHQIRRAAVTFGHHPLFLGYCSVTFFLKKWRSVTLNPPIIAGR